MNVHSALLVSRQDSPGCLARDPRDFPIIFLYRSFLPISNTHLNKANTFGRPLAKGVVWNSLKDRKKEFCSHHHDDSASPLLPHLTSPLLLLRSSFLVVKQLILLCPVVFTHRNIQPSRTIAASANISTAGLETI
jgi:hypothetical protein